MNMINKAIQYLSGKSSSEQEIRDYLENEFNDLPKLEHCINEAVTFLIKHNLISDQRLAENLTMHYAHKGNQFIYHLLQQRKIKKDVIEKSLNRIPNESVRAMEAVQNKMTTLSHLNFDEAKEILIRFMIGRQFSLETTNQVIDELNAKKTYRLKTKIWSNITALAS